MTIPNHTINAGTKLRLANLGFTFTCSQDANGSQHQYPRSTDPAYNTTLNVTSVGTTTADITGATYVPTTGILTITSNGHNLSTGDHIQIASESLTFTCAYDSNATNHTYPRQSDPIWGLWQPVTVVDGNTFTLDIGTSTDTTTHNFVSATTGALIKQTGAVTINVGASPSGQQYTYAWVSNVANAVITGGAYVHTFKSAIAGGVVADQKVNCEDDVLDLTDALVDDLRNGSNTHLWDASALYVNREANPVQLNHVETEIPQTLWVLNKHVELVNKIINNELITIQGDHSLTQYTDTTIYDSNNYGSLTQLTPSGATYDPVTGEMVITSAGHNLSTSSKVSFADDSFTFTCSQDDNASQHTYPRSTDPAYRRVLSVTAVSTNTFTVNVGVSPADRQYTHVFVSAATNAVTVLDYTSADCADVKQTIQNLMDIVVDTLTNANLPSPVDYLGTVTKLFPVYEFLGSYVDSFSEVPIELTDVFNNDDIVYANKFNVNAQYRFRDAANLIRLNRKAIVDKAAVDMISRYPHLGLSMPRNQDGSGAGTLRCKTDLGLILDAVANDIEEGGNLNLLTGLGLYFGANDEILHVRLQLVEGCYAHERLAFYAKQAVTGDIDSTNTDAVIVGDWGITNDPGNCANVTSAIDALIDLANISLAPTGDRYRDAGDLLLFNKEFIADEATLLLDAAFAYQLGVASYNAFSYPGGISVGRENCKDDIKDIIDSVIADLLTGGNSNTVKAIEYYITSSNGLKQFEDQILPAMYAYQQVRFLGKKAIRNLLVGIGDGASGDQYRAQYTPVTPYTDLTITDESGNSTYSDDDCADVINAFDNLIDLIIDTLTPGDTASRAAGRMLLFNANYYREEITNEVNAQWGSSYWTYNDFLTEMLNNTIHDMVTTDSSSYVTARTVELENITGTFTVGQPAYSGSNNLGLDTGRTSTLEVEVLEWYPKTSKLVVQIIRGSSLTAGYRIQQGSNYGTIKSTSGAISTAFNYYKTIGNVETIESARLIQSNVQGQVVLNNLFTYPEDLSVSGFTKTAMASVASDAYLAPDDTLTADSVAPDGTTAYHLVSRDYVLTSFTTFDAEGNKFDSSNETFDTGSVQETQTYTFSTFIKDVTPSGTPLDKCRFQVTLDPGVTAKEVKFDLDLSDGTFGSVFADTGATVEAYGSIPYGNGWYRAYITLTFSFGIGLLRTEVYQKNNAGAIQFAGVSPQSQAYWGWKLAKGGLDPYVSVSGETFYADNDFNIKNYIIDAIEAYYEQALDQTLTTPSPLAGFLTYTDTGLQSLYDTDSWMSVIRRNFDIIRNQLLNDSFITTIDTRSGIVVPTKTYGTRNIPIGVTGRVQPADNIIGLASGAYGEIANIRENEAKIVKVYQRFRINGEVTGEALELGEVVTSGGASGTIYAKYSDENNTYFDVAVTAGTFAVLNIITGANNSSTAEIGAIEDRLQVIGRQGQFDQGIEFKGFTSGATANVEEMRIAESAVLTNTGGKLTVDTESLTGQFEVTSVVYPQSISEYLEVNKFAGLDVQVGDRIASDGHSRLLISVIDSKNNFQVGNYLYNVIQGVLKDANNYGIITDLDLDNNYIYVSMVTGSFSNGDYIGDYSDGDTPVGFATISAKVDIAGAGAALVSDIKTSGLYKRLYLTDVVGTFSNRDTIISVDDYKAAVIVRKELRARVRRFFRGFDGTQTAFKLTTNNGDPYFPDPAGHMLIFVNGILQPPGATNAYTAFSDSIQFQEAPEIGSSFTGFYVGKLRQLDDISFDFDSLRQSFNLKREGTFYSLTLTEGVQSSVIKPENNIIVSLNGVIQEPGVGFEIVGSRIIFSEIPRFGSTFVAFSYVGSDQDVEAADIIPPIEPGDNIRIEGETEDREVAVIESSNSLITFDYLGSTFGKGAQASAVLTSGTIDKVSVTAGGSGYTSRPNVRIDSISGFDAQIKALVGVGGVVVSSAGTGYLDPSVNVESSVPDDWTAPDLSLYGEEIIDPEIL
jgi:hypothetical protein